VLQKIVTMQKDLMLSTANKHGKQLDILNKNDITPITDLFKDNNIEISDKHAIVTKFNEYFVNIGPTLANKISNSPGSCTEYLSGAYKDSFSLYATTPEEIVKIVKVMKPKKLGL